MTNTEKYFAKHGCDINADPLRFQTDIMMDKEYNSICFDTGEYHGIHGKENLETSALLGSTQTQKRACAVFPATPMKML